MGQDVCLNASFRVPRKAKNGEDGIGIKNADVMFALHTSNTTPPTPDNTNTWRTSIKDFAVALNGNNEKYVWTCTMITYTVGEPKFTGKYCLGKVSDFSDIEELYYVSDSNDSAQFEGKDLSKLFGATYTAVKGKYLWTVVRYTWNPNVNGAPINSWYSTPICTGAFGADGQNGQDGASAVTYEIQLDSDSVLFDTAKGDFVTIKLGYVHFIKHEGGKVVDMTSEVAKTSCYLNIIYGYAKTDENGNVVYGDVGYGYPLCSEKPAEGFVYAPINFGREDWNYTSKNLSINSSIKKHVASRDFVYAVKYIWYDTDLAKYDNRLSEIFHNGGEIPSDLDVKVLATKMFTVNRNGYSVSSVDVIYAIGDSSTTAPADNADWKTTFNELKGLSNFDSTHYVWSANRITMTDGTSSIKGKYCMGKCLDYADVTELYAMFSSNKLKDITLPTTNANLWKETYTAEKGKYLWTCNRYTNQNNVTIGYSTPACQSYFATDGKEGTSFVPCGSALAHYVSYAEFKKEFIDKGNTLKDGENILLDKAENTGKNYPCVCCLAGSEYSYDDATDGDAYVIAKNLWVNSPQKNAWVNMGDISGNKGEDGKPGVSPTVYKLALQLNGTRIYINVVKTTGSTTTTKLINQYKSELALNAYKDGAAFDDYHNEYFMEDGFVDLSAYQGVKIFTFVIKLLDGTNILDSANYSVAQDSFEFEINPDPVVFSTDEDGNLTENQKTSRISCSRGGKDITSMCTFEVQTTESLNCEPSAAYDSSYNPIKGGVSIQKIATETVGDVMTPATNGYAKVKVTDERSEIHYVYVKFQVNITKFINKVYNDNKTWGSQLSSIETTTSNLNKEQTEIKKQQAEIIAKVDNINLSVSEQRGGRFNLLMGSAFYKQGSGWKYYGSGVISCFGMDGCNALKLSSSYGSNAGVEWSADSLQGDIKLEKDKAHTLAVFIKPTAGNCTLTMQVAYKNNDGAYTILKDTTFSSDSMVANSWNKAILQFTSSQNYEYYRVRIYITSSSYSEAYLSKPVLVDDGFKGWSFNKDDYDYVGGNMLSNTKQLTLGDNLTTIGGTVAPNFYGDSAVVSHTFEYKLLGILDSFDISNPPQTPSETNCGYAISGNADAYIYDGSTWVEKKGEGFTELLRWGFDGENIGANANKDYIFSFYAKGTGILQVFLYKSNASVQIEGSDGSVAVSTDGMYQIQLNNLWTRYWVHWIPSSGYSQFVLIRLVRTWTDGTSSSTWAWVSQPKLESGAHMTDYTERSADMVNKAALKKAGIEITSEQVKLYGEKVLVMNQTGNDSNGNPTYMQAAMFKGGKLNANLIDAGEVVANGINAKEITATNLNVKGNSTFGIWTVDGNQITTKGSFEFNGATYVGQAIQYTAGFIRAGSVSTKYMRLGAYTAEFGEFRNNAYNGIWFGSASNTVYNGNSNSWELPTDCKYKEVESATVSGTPTVYIHNNDTGDNPAFAINRPNGGVALRTNGALKGSHAFNTRRTSSTLINMQNGEGLVVCTSDNATSVYLPKNPVIGEMVTIIQSGNGKLSIYGNGHKTISGKDVESDGRTSETKGQINLFFFDGVRWICTYITNWLGKV